MRKNKTEIKQKKMTVFDIPSDDAKQYLSSIIKDVDTIISNPKFMQATKKVEVPDNATIKDYEEMLTRIAPAKLYSFLTLFIDDCYDELRRILSAVFITDFEYYKKKSLKAMCEDIASLGKDNLGVLLGFFTRSGK